MDYTEFCEILQVDPSPQCEGVFQLYDYDRTGQIDAREFLIAVSNYTGAGKEDKLKFAFMCFDEDGNGVITQAELLNVLKANHMASHDAEVARKADTIMAQADKVCSVGASSSLFLHLYAICEQEKALHCSHHL